MAVVGIFDSGSGGLSVLKEIRRLLPGLKYIYYSDNANCPYGTKSSVFIRARAREITELLMSKGASSVVVACNTATAYGIDAVRELARANDVETIGVVDAGVEATLDALKWVRTPYAVAVMATPGQIAQIEQLPFVVRTQAIQSDMMLAGMPQVQSPEGKKPSGKVFDRRTNMTKYNEVNEA